MSGCLVAQGAGVSLCGRAPDVFSPRTLWSVVTKGVFHAVAFSQPVDALAVDRTLVKKIFLAAVVLDEPESPVRPQRLNLSCHSFASALYSRCCSVVRRWPV